ncbi:hypothetical protein ACFLZQ_04750 [Thermodesulfobacteriota bacterium]
MNFNNFPKDKSTFLQARYLCLFLLMLLIPIDYTLAGQQIIGEWFEKPNKYFSQTISIISKDNQLLLISKYQDGSSNTSTLKEETPPRGYLRKFKDITSGHGEYYQVTQDGNLGMYDSQGFIREAKKISYQPASKKQSSQKALIDSKSPITVDLENIKLVQVIRLIGETSGKNFSIDNELLEEKISISVTDTPLNVFYAKVLNEKGLDNELRNGSIHIFRRQETHTSISTGTQNLPVVLSHLDIKSIKIDTSKLIITLNAKKIDSGMQFEVISAICTNIDKHPTMLDGISEIKVMNFFDYKGFIFEGGKNKCREFNETPLKMRDFFIASNTHMHSNY